MLTPERLQEIRILFKNCSLGYTSSADVPRYIQVIGELLLDRDLLTKEVTQLTRLLNNVEEAAAATRRLNDILETQIAAYEAKAGKQPKADPPAERMGANVGVGSPEKPPQTDLKSSRFMDTTEAHPRA